MFYRSGASSSIRRSEFPSCPEKRHSEAVFKPPQLWISRISSRFSRRMTVPRGRFGGQNVIVMYSCIDLAFGNSRQVQLSVGKHASILHMMSLLRCMAVCIPLLKARDNITLRLGNSSSIPSMVSKRVSKISPSPSRFIIMFQHVRTIKRSSMLQLTWLTQQKVEVS